MKAKEGFRIKKSEIPDAGLGLYTTKPIPYNKNVTTYSGNIVHSQDPNFGGPYVLEVGPHRFIDASKTNEPGLGRWINHKPKRQANTRFVVHAGQALMRTTRNVAKDKELTVPYGRQYWRHFRKKVRG